MGEADASSRVGRGAGQERRCRRGGARRPATVLRAAVNRYRLERASRTFLSKHIGRQDGGVEPIGHGQVRDSAAYTRPRRGPAQGTRLPPGAARSGANTPSAGRRLTANRPGQTGPDRGQELLRCRVRARAGRCGAGPATPGTQGRGRTPRCAPVHPLATDHQIHQPDLHKPTGPGTARRSYPSRGDRACPTTHPRPDRRDLTQRQNRRPRSPIPHRLRPLTPWNMSSSSGGGQHHAVAGGVPGRCR